jgi:hypothetical protein
MRRRTRQKLLAQDSLARPWRSAVATRISILPIFFLLSSPVCLGGNDDLPGITTSYNTQFGPNAIGARIEAMFGATAKAEWDEALFHADLVEIEEGKVGAEGKSDSDTIGIDSDRLTLDQAAFVCWHESHHSNAAAYAASPGSSNAPDPNNQGPCGACNHAQQYLVEVNALAASSCNSNLGTDMCWFFDQAADNVDDLIDECAAAWPPCGSIPNISSADVDPMCGCGEEEE